MAQLRQDYKKFLQRDAEIIVIGPEDPNSFRAYFEKEKLPFIGLADPTHSVLKHYGQEVNIFKLGRMPGQMIIDKSGILRFIHYGHDMTDIPSNQEILELLDFLQNETKQSV